MKFQTLAEGWLDQAQVLRLAERLLNHTEEHTYTNPIDIATVIHLLSLLVSTQGERPQTVSWSEHGQRFARAQEIYPTFNQTLTFCEMVSRIVNNLLRPKNEVGWNATQPSGSEGDNLMRVMHNFADAISRSLIYHIIDGRVILANAHIYQYHEYIEVKIITQWVEKVSGVEFPSDSDVSEHGMDRTSGFLSIKKEELVTNLTKNTVFYGISVFRYKNLAKVLPSHDVHSRTKEDWVNSPVMAFYLHQADLNVNCSPSPYSDEGISIHLPVLDTFNISNPECVRLVHAQKKRQWRWSTQHCTLKQFDLHSTTCCCDETGVFAVTTDMYNDNWDKGDKRPQLLNFASYFGCAASATMCLLTCAIHVYLKTSSTTAALHRNFSVSTSLSQLAFMFGIDRYDNQLVCQAFAVLLHYFFLSSYCWLMNEAFNLYIVITYSAHSNNNLADTGSMLRYYVLGWVIPGVLVGAFVGTADKYYAEDMCWVSPYHIWLFLGPAIGIICITILVQIFTAKEHNENSYTKSEKTNKIITINMKGLWIQLILVTVCWSFAFMSIHIYDRIIKLLYALFNSLQGAFFVVFYLLLHEEVRVLLKSHQKKKALAKQGLELAGDDHSIDSFASNLLVDKDGKDSISLEARPKRRHVSSARKAKTRIEASSDEASEHSDSEMISSV
ncbi:adhesion G protein-coupled receptor L2-like [Pomacea canaliculata]|uniref:adhesion G protein-coupled receptor L2-like n=1 Tax=Pomacea canaliculata TaxID=400727 RepID=UPI000D734460|nr:adhesion G protein-coupled receptor L2-like [Pomacea canaliculata]